MNPNKRKQPCQNCRREVKTALAQGARLVDRGCCGVWRLVGGKISR